MKIKKLILIIFVIPSFIFSLELGDEVTYYNVTGEVNGETYGQPQYFGNCLVYFTENRLIDNTNNGTSSDDYFKNRDDFWECISSPKTIIAPQNYTMRNQNENCTNLQYTGLCIDSFDDEQPVLLSTFDTSLLTSLIYETNSNKKFLRSFLDIPSKNIGHDVTNTPFFENVFRIDMDLTQSGPASNLQYIVLSNKQTNKTYEIDLLNPADNFVKILKNNLDDTTLQKTGNLVCRNGTFGPNLIDTSNGNISLLTDEGTIITPNNTDNQYFGCQQNIESSMKADIKTTTIDATRQVIYKVSTPIVTYSSKDVCNPNYEYLNGVCSYKQTQYTKPEFCNNGTIVDGQCVENTEFKGSVTVTNGLKGISRICWDDYISVTIDGQFNGNTTPEQIEVFNSRNNELFRKIFQSGGVVLSMSTTDNNFVDSINALGVEDVQVVPNENQDFKYCLYNKSLPENDIIKVITTLHTIDINQPYTISYLHRNLDKIQKNGLLNIVVNSTNTNVFTDKKTISSSRITEECEQGYIVVDGQCQLDLFKDSVNKCILDNTIKLHKIQNMNTQSEVIAATQNGELTSVDAVMLNNTIYQYKATTPYTLNGIVYTYIWTDNLTGDGKINATSYFPQ